MISGVSASRSSSGRPVRSPRGRCRRRGRARIRGRDSGPSPIITASDMTRPLVMSRLARIRSASTSRPSSTKRVCFSAPAVRQKVSGSTIHSISHGPVERSWSATIASISAAACWRTTEIARVDVARRDRIALLRHGAATSRGPARRARRPRRPRSASSASRPCASLPSVPPTRPRKQPTSAMVSRTVCQAITGWPRPSSFIRPACVSRRALLDRSERAGGAAELADQHARPQFAASARDGARSRPAASPSCSRR